MEIIILLENGKRVTIEVFETEKIRDLKNKCQEKIGLNFDKLTLTYNNKILDDENKTIFEHQIVSKSIITVNKNIFQIFVTTVDGMTLAIDVHNSTQIIDLKHSIQRKIGINLNEQILIYRAKILNDDQTLDQYGINRESIIIILNRSKVLIFFQLSDVTIAIHANYHDKIIDLKYLINEKTGLELTGQMLSYQNRLLEDDKTVTHYQLHDKSVISVFNKDAIKIFITTMDGKRQEFIIQKTDKVIDVKKKIQQKIKLIPDEQKLIFQGSILKDEKYVKEYHIIDQSVVNVVARLRSGLKIFVKIIDGKKFPIEVEKSDKIIDIKYKIEEKTELHRDSQQLVYLGRILDDDNKTIDEYQIADKYVINIVVRLRMKIFAKTMDGKKFPIEVQKSDKIIDMKNSIQDKLGLQPDEQKLVYQDKILNDDERTIDEYQIRDRSVINVVAKLRRHDGMKLFVKTLDGKIFELEVEKSDKIIDLKNKIYEKSGWDQNKQKLFYQSRILDDDNKTIDEYGITEKSVIKFIGNVSS